MKSKMMKVVTLIATCFLASLLVIQVAHAAYPAPPSLESEVFVDGGYGFGSSGIYVRRFSNVDVNTGTDITYTDDTVYGDSFTINTNGIYAISYTDWRRDGNYDSMGVSVNASPTSTWPQNYGGICTVSTYIYQQASCSATLYLNNGDVVRPHWVAGAFAYPQPYGSDVIARFVITKVR